MRYSMHFFWESIIHPLLQVVHPVHIVEIGSEYGEHTMDLLRFCERQHAKLTVIDPDPHFPWRDWEQAHGDYFRLVQERSLQAIPLLEKPDVVIIDGDHNWYTVYHELQLIARQMRPDDLFPLVLLHDTGWPFGRRDHYDDPGCIPGEYRKPYRVPNETNFQESSILDIVAQSQYALEENGQYNGVLTAVEDFVAQSGLPLRSIQIPGFFGLGILADDRSCLRNHALARMLDSLRASDPVTRHMDALETERLHAYQREVIQERHATAVEEREALKYDVDLRRAAANFQNALAHNASEYERTMKEKEREWSLQLQQHSEEHARAIEDKEHACASTIEASRKEFITMLEANNRRFTEIIDQNNQEFSRKLMEKDNALSRVFASRSWRYTYPLRRLEQWIRGNSAPVESPRAHGSTSTARDVPAHGEAQSPLTACTIISKNYLSYARVFARSYKEHHPDAEVCVLLVDRLEGYFDPASEPFTLVQLEDLGIPNLPAFCFRYSIVELNTAVKPYFLSYLFRRKNVPTLAYFDPDILVTGPMHSVGALLAGHNIVLTPHITRPIDDDAKPDERGILRVGAYNLGFIALRHSPETDRFLGWWQSRLEFDCLHDVREGLFVDQKWIDLVPGMFQDVAICRDPGYNVAYWNLHERRLEQRGKEWFVNGVPLAFFHFSGFDPDQPQRLSVYQNRFQLRDRSDLQPLFEEYTERQVREGYNACSAWPYAFAFFSNGVRIPSFLRRVYLALGAKASAFGDPFDAGSSGTFYASMLHTVATDDEGRTLLRIHEYLHEYRSEIASAYPDIRGKDMAAYLTRLQRESTRELYELDDVFLPRPAHAAKRMRIRNPFRMSIPRLYHSFPGRVMGHTLRRILPRRLFQDIAAKVRRRVGIGPVVTRRLQSVALPDGINVAGYITSESGVGESARRSILAARAAGIPHALNNFPITSARAFDRTYAADFRDDNPYATNVIHVNADQMPVFLEYAGVEYLNKRRNIGYWVWELPVFPPEWHDRFQFVQEIWAPSEFSAAAIRKASPVPVRVLMHPVDLHDTSRFTRTQFDLPDDRFVFLFMFDVLSVFERKNPLAVIEAFTKAFTPDEPVTLLIKYTNAHGDPAAIGRMLTAALGHDIRFIDRHLDAMDVHGLISVCDSYVSLHRSEGFGLTIAEAMAMDKPVVATAYSANMEYMTEKNSFPVRCSLVELREDYGPYAKGNMWAEPDTADAARQMRIVYENREHALRVGRRAGLEIRNGLSARKIGAHMRSYLHLGS